ncbi:hypothetical protein GOBAR_DD28180 [Gossypium barbadense]|nr:hypothetical protein GOBAR_DD28180 [Gossypium barbadense]
MDPKLYRAVIKGYVASMRDLASSDSRFVLLQVTPQGDNIVHVAAKHDVKQIADALVQFPQSNFCIKRTQKATLHCTLQQGWGNHDTALRDAVRNGHEEIVNLLIRRDPELALLTNNVGESPLFSAADKRHDRIAKPILNVAPDYSIEDQQDNEGNTALHLAVLRGRHGKIFKSMIEDVRVDKAIANSAGHTEEIRQEKKNRARQQSERKLEPGTAIDEQDLVGEEYARFRKLNFNQVQQIASTNLPVITIIATVSFAAGFTMPGGSLKQKLDVLAFYTNYATLLSSLAIIPMAVAFASGSYISLSLIYSRLR